MRTELAGLWCHKPTATMCHTHRTQWVITPGLFTNGSYRLVAKQAHTKLSTLCSQQVEVAVRKLTLIFIFLRVDPVAFSTVLVQFRCHGWLLPKAVSVRGGLPSSNSWRLISLLLMTSIIYACSSQELCHHQQQFSFSLEFQSFRALKGFFLYYESLKSVCYHCSRCVAPLK